MAKVQKEVNRYEKECSAYLESYRSYLTGLARRQQLMGCRKRVKLVINNEGTEPAYGVRIRISVPDGVAVCEERDWPDASERPQRPDRPKTTAQLWRESLYSPLGPIIPSSIFNARVPDVSRFDPDEAGPSITPRDSTLLEWSRSKVMHRLPLELTPLMFTFQPIAEEHTYDMRYWVYAENLATPIEGSLRIVTRGSVRPFQPSPIPE